MVVIVKHYLNQEGKAFFPSWINSARKVLKEFQGFVSIEQIIPLEDENQSMLLLRFKSHSQLKIWATSAEHEILMDSLKPYMISKQKSEFFYVAG